MRLIAIHDTAGRISALHTSPPNSPPGGLEMRVAQIQTELEVSEMNFDFSEPHIQNRLVEIIENYQVECGPAKARIIRKADITSSK